MRPKSKAPLVLALPMTLIAAIILVFSILPALYDWGRMQSWVPVEATLVSGAIDARHGGVTKWSTAFKVNAKYRYHYNEQPYEGERVGIHDRSYDSVGTWHRDILDAMERMRPLRVWVNPRHPDEAIFDRTLRWNLLSISVLFVLFFGGLGVAGLLAAFGNEVMTTQPSSHHQIKADWRKSSIQSDRQLWGTWYLFFVIFLFFIWMAYQAINYAENGNSLALVSLFFPLACIPVFSRLVRTTVTWRQLGVMPLHLFSLPSVLGRNISGSITLNQCLSEDAIAGVSLRCISTQQGGSAMRTRNEPQIIWSEQRLLRCEDSLGSNELQFDFALPETVPAAPGQVLVWKLLVKIKCDTPAIDHTGIYTIPVVPATN